VEQEEEMSMNLVGIAGIADPVVPVAPSRPGYMRFSVGQEAPEPWTQEEMRRGATVIFVGGVLTLGAIGYAMYRFIKWEEAQHGA
jgi:hypothetical protein